MTSRGSGKSPAAFRTISEVATELDIPQHVLRFWEGRFPQIKPIKRGGGRRYYRPEDVALLRRIRQFLYADGYTIKGVQKLLKDVDVREPATSEVTAEPELEHEPEFEHEPPFEDCAPEFPLHEQLEPGSPDIAEGIDSERRAVLEAALDDLSALRDMLAKALARGDMDRG